jgi:type I restriction enzyme S subunit
MSEHWKIYSVKDLIELEILERPMDGNHGEIHPSGSDFTETGIPFIMATDIKNGILDLANCKFISKEQAEQLRTGFSYTNDVLLTHKASIGRTAIVPHLDVEYIMLTPQVTYYRIKDKAKLDYRFLKFYFDTNKFQQILNSYANSGSTRAYIGITEQLSLPISLPPIEDQQAIATILSSLNDKIELNLQMNQTLEAISQAIYKEWFVNFKFADIDSQMLEGLPMGWRKSTVGNIAKNIQYGYTQSSSLEEIGPKFLRITDIQNGNVDWSQVPYCSIDDRDYKKYRIQDHDIFIARTGASTGENIYIIEPPSAVFASYLIRIQFEKPEYAFYIGKFLRRRGYFSYISSSLGGSAQPNANAKTLTNIEVIVPDDQTLKNYFDLAFSFHLRIVKNQKENQILTQIRDNLLPRLITGKIEVKA